MSRRGAAAFAHGKLLIWLCAFYRFFTTGGTHFQFVGTHPFVCGYGQRGGVFGGTKFCPSTAKLAFGIFTALAPFPTKLCVGNFFVRFIFGGSAKGDLLF